MGRNREPSGSQRIPALDVPNLPPVGLEQRVEVVVVPATVEEVGGPQRPFEDESESAQKMGGPDVAHVCVRRDPVDVEIRA